MVGTAIRPGDVVPGDGPLDPTGVKRLRSEFGSTGVLLELVELFGAQTPARLISMRAAIAARDGEAVGAHAHQLKGGCLTLAANHMAALCDELEISVRGETWLVGAPALLDQIEVAFDQALAALLSETASCPCAP